MDVIMVTVGTDGDVLPYVGLGAKLRARGHRVRLAAAAPYQGLAEAHGLELHALISKDENDELFNNPDFWNPLKAGPVAARWGMRFIRRQYELLLKLASPNAVLVANPGVFAAAMVHERFGTPLASLVLQPGLIPSSIAPPVMPGFLFLRRAPRPVWKLFWRGLDVVGHGLAGRKLNRVRASLGLKPLRRMFQNWLSTQLALGMFPDWYGPAQVDWPPQIRLCGFPAFDGRSSESLPPALDEFCRAGGPPVTFTFGTGMRHSARLFRAALDACDLLGARGIFLTRHADQLPPGLPASIFHSEFARFETLFPRCAAVVHHGGIGTTARAMAAGVPQLVCPICFDQFDNGVRVAGLGAGEWLKPRHVDGPRIAAALARLKTPVARARCEKIASRFVNHDALEMAATWVEKLEK
jgi:rhamnosyltransferase subunit B